MKKKNLFIFTFFLLLIIGSNNVNALTRCSELSEEDLNFYASLNRTDIYDLSCANGTPYTDEYIAKLNQAPNSIFPRYYVNRLSVPLLAQERDYWCGPAATQQVLATKQTSYKSQAELAASLKTTSQGTGQTRIAGVLNSELNISKYTHVQVSSLSMSEFYNIIERSINLGYPLVMNIRMEALPAYNNSATGGHYITISGHTITSILGNDYSAITVYYVDPNRYNSNGYGNHSVSLPTLKAATGGYIIYAA